MTNGTGILAVVLGVLALGVAVAVFVSFASVRRRLIVLQGKAGRDDILEAVARQVEEVRAVREEIRVLAGHLQALTEAFRGALQRFAVHRYDAFEDMGGKMSFSAAFLNDHGDGIVISCINGRQEARSYAKPVAAARSEYNLSPEEEEAIRQALSGRTM
jgi:hypothetical protein